MTQAFGFTVQARRRRMIQISNGMLAVVAMAFVLFRLVNLGWQDPPVPAFSIAVLITANAVFLGRGGSMDLATWFLFAALLLGLVLVGINSGGFHGPTVLLSPILPVLAALLMSANAAWVASAIVVAVLTVLLSLEHAGIISPSPHSADALLLSRYLALVSTVVVCTSVAWIFSNFQGDLLEEVRREADTDHLTGLSNRRAIENALLREIGRARRGDNWLSLVMTDVDHFKRYNDNNGHQAGDRCLVQVAEVLRANAQRPADLAGRFGGEEFIVLLAETDHRGACNVAEKIRKSMLDLRMTYEASGDEPVTLTLGVVSIRGSDLTSFEQLLREADTALYEGKRQGRNQVIGRLIEGEQITASQPAILPG